MKEVGAVIGSLGNVLYWHDPEGSTGGSLPDSSMLWDVMLEAYRKGILAGFAHTHPGSGWPAPSHTDLTTFAAIERGLGVSLTWWIASSDNLIALRCTPNNGYFSVKLAPPDEDVLAPWVHELRRRSEYLTAEQRQLRSMTKCPPGCRCTHEQKCTGCW